MRNNCGIAAANVSSPKLYICTGTHGCDFATSEDDCDYQHNGGCLSSIARAAALTECIAAFSKELFEMNRKIGKVEDETQ